MMNGKQKLKNIFQMYYQRSWIMPLKISKSSTKRSIIAKGSKRRNTKVLRIIFRIWGNSEMYLYIYWSYNYILRVVKFGEIMTQAKQRYCYDFFNRKALEILVEIAHMGMCKKYNYKRLDVWFQLWLIKRIQLFISILLNTKYFEIPTSSV